MIVLIIGALTPLLLKMLEIATAKAQLPGQTVERMKAVDQALAAFVSAKRRLPCPADGTIPSSMLGVGTEARDASGDCTAQTTGVVPWITLGLSEADVTDSWGGRFTFRVPTGSAGLTRDSAMNSTFCDSMGTGPVALGTPFPCLNTCVSPISDYSICSSAAAFLTNRGLLVKDGAGSALCSPIASTGAAYVVISHGSEGGGAYDSRGVLTTSTVPPGTGESQNLNNQSIPGSGYFHSLAVAVGPSTGTSHFDDVLSHPTIANLLVKTGLGARIH